MTNKNIEIHAAQVTFYPTVSVETGNYPVFEFDSLQSALNGINYYAPEDGSEPPPLVVYAMQTEGYMILDNVFYKFPISKEDLESEEPYYYGNKANQER
jgi:hypothetical protein